MSAVLFVVEWPCLSFDSSIKERVEQKNILIILIDLFFPTSIFLGIKIF